MSIILFIIGLIGIYFSSDWLISSALRLGQRLRWSEATVGFLVIGIGTSAPEIAISFFGLFSGETGVLTGNIAGSCLANALLIFGVALCLSRSSLRAKHYESSAYLLLLTALFSLGIYLDGFDRWLAVLLFLIGALALFRILKVQKHSGQTNEKVPESKGFWVFLAPLISLCLVVFCAKLIIDNGLQLASAWGLDAGLFGLTLVAIGTSLPELVLAVISVRRGYPHLLVGNIIGSNVSNIALGIGLPALYRPFKASLVDPLGVVFILMASVVFFLIVCHKNIKRQWLFGVLSLLGFVGAYVFLFIVG